MGLGLAAVAEEFDSNGEKFHPLAESMRQTYTDSVSKTLKDYEFNFVITDPRLPDNPIVYASEGFCKASGYSREEVFGRNCPFLQGPHTDRRTLLELRDAIREERSARVRILSYAKGGKPFWNIFQLSPLFSNADGTVTHFVGVQTPISVQSASSRRDTDKPFCRHVLGSDPDISSLESVWPNKFSRIGDSSATEWGVHTLDLRPTGRESHGYSSFTAIRNVNEEVEIWPPKDGEIWKDDPCKPQGPESLKAVGFMKRLASQLVESSNGKVLQDRGKRVSECVATGVVSSSLLLSLTKIQQSFVLADPRLPDAPIVHASESFLRLTGYKEWEVVGRNCRFLQGPATDAAAVAKIRESMSLAKPCCVRLVNYRKDNTPFWNLLHISPIRSCDGKVAFFVGVQLQVAEVEEEHKESIGMSARMMQLSTVGAVRVAVRGGGLVRT